MRPTPGTLAAISDGGSFAGLITRTLEATA